MTKSDFIRYIEATQEWLRRFLASLCCGDMMLVDDIAQETYLKAYLSIESCRDERKLKGWMLKIAYNTFLNHTRSRHLFREINECETIASDLNTDNAFNYENLYQALGALPPKERGAVVLFYLEGYSSKEIAALMETTDANVRQMLSRGRVHLKVLLKK